MAGITIVVASMIDAVKNLLKLIDVAGMFAGGKKPMLNLAGGSDGDNGNFAYPPYQYENGVASSTTTPEENYSYSPKLSGLIKKVEVDFFSRNNYQPYYSGMGTMNRDAGLIGIHIDFDKDAFNELIIMIDVIVLNLMISMNRPENDDSKEASTQKSYFVDISQYAVDNSRHDTDNAAKWLTHRDSKALLSYFWTNYVNKDTTTQQKVDFLEPYVRSIPYTFVKWALRDAALGALKEGDNLWDDPYIINWTIGGVLGFTLENLSKFLGGILPIPFASGTINPSAHIYIDLNPTASEYGRSGYTMQPGIQAIELMINAKKNGAGTSMMYN
ncbi:MAG: hypothetical protein K2M36_04805, partial [Clostridia bacterium]|nr:hypothetical protein [Clostridia bacterium]